MNPLPGGVLEIMKNRKEKKPSEAAKDRHQEDSHNQGRRIHISFSSLESFSFY